MSILLKEKVSFSADHDENDSDLATYKRFLSKDPLIYFTSSNLPVNTCLAIHRSLFTADEQENDSFILEALRKRQFNQNQVTNIRKTLDSGSMQACKNIEPHFFLCMIGGGHFAAMIVSLVPKQDRFASIGPLAKENDILAHKTFHRYTTRRKQGGAQSANDSSKGAAHSAGATLRRYNEQALMEEVRNLLGDWKDMINSSELLFIRATGTISRRTLYGPYDGQVLKPKDPRIRGFPFSTRRATQNELMRSFIELTRVKFLAAEEKSITATQKNIPETAIHSKAAEPSKKSFPDREITEEQETALLHTSQIQALIRRNRLPALLNYFETNSLSPDFRFHPLDSSQNNTAPTPLLLAAHLNSSLLVTGLLVKGNCNPALKNQNGKTAYDLASDRATRNAFRVARYELGENKWNWQQIGIPSAMTSAEAKAENDREKQENEMKEQQRRNAEIERLRAESSALTKDNASQGKMAARSRMLMLGQVPKSAQDKREEEARGLTPEMRMRLDRERRARAAEERMKKMASGK